jgi:hypothetical protein
MTGSQVMTGREAVGAAPAKLVRPRAVGEVILVASLFLVYKAGRALTAGHAAEATAHAAAVWHLERLLHFPSEFAFQQAVVSRHWLMLAANCYYAYVHFPATAACLIWLYLRRPELYRPTRQILAGLTAAALVLHVTFPLAPPRLAPGTGLLDTGRLFGPAVYGPPSTDTFSNQYAAMPSLHVGWAVVVGVVLFAATRHRLRWLWLAHPVITLSVVVATGNHYWLDAVVAVVLLLAVSAVVLRADAWRPILTRLRAILTRLRPVSAPQLRRYALGLVLGGAVVVVVVMALRGHAPPPAEGLNVT